MDKKILLIIYTHGNEKIGGEVLEGLKKKGLDRFFDCLVANPKAAEKNVRFLETDLNRSYPGEKDSKVYEKKIAFENLKIAQKYEFIIDIHEASSGINDFIIIPRDAGKNSFPLELIDLDIVLFWPDPKGPIGQILENSIELEFGTNGRDRARVVSRAERIMEVFIKNVYAKESGKKTFPDKQLFFVYGKIMTNEFFGQNLIDFEKTTINGETFYPLLVGQYRDIGIECYKMKFLSM